LEKYFAPNDVLANDALATSMKRKNKREKLGRLLTGTDLKPYEVAIVGDTPEEVEIGKFFRIVTVAITDGYCSTRRLIKSRPSHLISNLGELPEILKR